MMPITPRYRAAIRAMLDLAAESNGRCPTLQALADRMGWRNRSTAQRFVAGLDARGLVKNTGARPMFHARCFKVFRVNPESGGLDRVA